MLVNNIHVWKHSHSFFFLLFNSMYTYWYILGLWTWHLFAPSLTFNGGSAFTNSSFFTLFFFFKRCCCKCWRFSLPSCEGSPFTFDLGHSNRRNRALPSFYFGRMCAFIRDATAECEYEYMKSSSWVRSGSDIHEDYIHNVFCWLWLRPVLHVIMSAGLARMCLLLHATHTHTHSPLGPQWLSWMFILPAYGVVPNCKRCCLTVRGRLAGSLTRWLGHWLTS